MTTIAVVRKNNQVAIAADTLTKWGYSKETAHYVANHQKILQIEGNYLGIAGATSGKLILSHYFSHSTDPIRLESVEEIFATWLPLHETLKSRYYLNPTENAEDSFESTQFDVLIANPHGIFGVSRHRAVQEFSRFYAYGSGGEYAMGAMFTAYDDPNTSAQEIAELGIQVAAEFDDGTGLPLISFTVALAD